MQEESGALLSPWVLEPGRTAPPEQHVFAGQYNNTSGRDAKDETYAPTHGTAAGVLTVRGGFAPTG